MRPSLHRYLEIITGAEGEDIRLAMSYQKPGSLKFGVDPHRLRDVFKTQSATCPRAFWETAISCCEESPAKRPETDQIISRLQTLYASWTEAEGTIHRFIPQKDGAKLWLSLIISVRTLCVCAVSHAAQQFEGTAITSVTMEALLSELKQQIAAISHRDLDQSEVDFLTDLIGTSCLCAPRMLTGLAQSPTMTRSARSTLTQTLSRHLQAHVRTV